MTAEALAHELPDEQAKLARNMMDATPAATAGPRPPGGADQFSYHLRLDDGARQRAYQWSEQEVPDEVRPLLAELNRRAHPASPA